MKPALWLSGLAAGLASILAFELTQPDPGESARARIHIPPMPGTSTGATAPGGQTPPPGPDAGALDRAASGILARPLFSSSRRPPAASPAGAKTAAAAVGGVPRLTGTIVGPYERRAIFAGDDGKARSIGEGGVIGGYKVRSIDPGVVTVSGSDGDREIRPSFAGASQIQSGTVRPANATQGTVR